MKLIELIEAKSNSASNLKIPAYDELSKYKGDDNVFIHFSDISMVSLYPDAKYRTPVGIYGYPLNTTWSYYKVDQIKSFKNYPQGHRKFIHIFRVNKLNKLLNANNYTKAKEDITKLIEIYPSIDVRSEWGWLSNKHYNQFQLFWEITKFIAKQLDKKNYEQKWSSVIKKLGYNGVIETKPSGLIFGNEPIQMFVFSRADIELIDFIKNADYKGK